MGSEPWWHALPSFPDSPALFISTTFDSSSYSIQITDLANIWSETLNRKGILKRALNDEISIDLSDGDRTQWALFMEKLGAALDPASVDHHLTSLVLAHPTTNADDLVLYVTHVLPEPLPPLKWPIELAKCRPAELASGLVLPLIQSQRAHVEENDELVARLKEKDAVISKLVDKLEATGTGLEHVFNSLAGKRKVSRAVAEGKVPGLSPFQPGDDRKARSKEVFRNFPIPDDGDGVESVEASTQLNDWWRDLTKRGKKAVQMTTQDEEQDDENVVLKSSPKKTPSPDMKNKKRNEPSQVIDDEDDGDFQVQATPPHMRAARTKQGQAPAKPDVEMRDDDDATDDENECIKETQRPASPKTVAVRGKDDAASDDDDMPPRREPIRRTGGGGLGAIGGANKKSRTPPPPSLPAASQSDEETASGSDSDLDDTTNNKNHASPSKPATVAKDFASPQKKSGGLGMIGGIGGRKPTSPLPPPPKPDPAPAASTGAPDFDPDETVDPDETMGSISSPKSPSPPPPPPKEATTTAVMTSPKSPVKPPASRRIGAIGGIGGIGGRKTTAAATTPSAASADDSSSATATAGGKRARPGSSASAASASAPSSSSVTLSGGGGESPKKGIGGIGGGKPGILKGEDGKEENDEERAERRRAELAKELERKATAPAKKKRRF